MPKYGRILLKLSGEALAGRGGFGWDPEEMGRITAELVELRNAGVELGIVVGGGNLMRGRDAGAFADRVQADYIGMLGTVMNALALQDRLEGLGQSARVQTTIPMPPIAEPYERRRALHDLSQGRVVIFAAGTGHPFFSTDTTAALRAAEIGAGCLVKGTNVDGVYDSDPRKNPNARFLPSLTYAEALEGDIRVMDAAAFSLCRDNHIPTWVLNIQKPGCLTDALLKGARTGTTVKEEA